MALESATYINTLDAANPTASDPKSAGDDHLRMIKSAVKVTFPNVAGAVNPSHSEFNYLVGVTSSVQSQINTLTGSKGAIAGQAWSGTQDFSGATLIAPTKATKAGDTYTGTHNFSGATEVMVPTPSNASDAATKSYVDASISPSGVAPMWVSGTTYSVGNCVFSPSDLYTYRCKVAGVSVTDPVNDSTKWLSMTPNLNGGATETSSAVDVMLTSASNRVQAVSMSVSGKSVILPNATTLTTGGALFVIKNTGTITFPVRNSAGVVIAVLAVGQIAGLYLTNNSTAAGTWAVGNQSFDTFLARIFVNTSTVVNAAVTDYCTITKLSATQVLAVWAATGTGYVQACTLNISGTTISAGAILTVNAVSSSYLSVTAMSATQAVLTYIGTTSYVQACTLNISGTTVTNGAIISVNAVASSQTSVTAMSATQAVVAYVGATSYVQSCTLNVSGTTITNGTILTVNAVASGTPSVAMLSSTQAVLVYYNTSSTALTTCTLNVSGTTLTTGVILIGSGAGFLVNNGCSVIALSSTLALVTYRLNNTQYVNTISVSGTTCTWGTYLQIPGTSNGAKLSAISATQAVLVLSDTYLWSFQITVIGTLPTIGIVGVVVTTSPGWPVYIGIVPLSSGQHLCTYQNVSNYPTAVILEPTL